MRKILLFDMDGTLTDSMPVFSRIVLGVMKEDGARIPDGIIRRMSPMALDEFLDLMMELGCKGDRESLIPRLDMRAAYANEVPLKPGVEAFLKRMKEEGHRLFVLTGSPHANADPCLMHNGVFSLFDRVYNTGDFGMSKHTPEIYHALCRREGFTPADVTFFDDNLGALTAARQAGMEVIGVADDADAEDEGAIRALADGYVESFGDRDKNP